jgi:hypothetical protein
MKDRVIMRTKSNLSFGGEIYSNNLIEDRMGILLKTNPNSEIKIWFPVEEIECIIMSNEKIIKGDEIKNEFGL